MKSRILCIALGFLCITTTAIAGRFSTTEYECSQMDKERDRMKCKVRYDEQGGTLLMFLHWKQSDPEAQRARTKYLIGATIHNFLASGGRHITQRVISPDGRLRSATATRSNVAEANIARAGIPLRAVDRLPICSIICFPSARPVRAESFPP